MTFKLFVETDADDEKLAEVRGSHTKDAPVYCLTSNVAVKKSPKYEEEKS